MTLPVHGAPHCLRSLEPVLRQRRGSRREREGRTSVSPLPSTLRLHLRNLGNLSGKCDHDQDLILHFSIIGELRNLLGQLRWQTIGLDTFRKLGADLRCEVLRRFCRLQPEFEFCAWSALSGGPARAALHSSSLAAMDFAGRYCRRSAQPRHACCRRPAATADVVSSKIPPKTALR